MPRQIKENQFPSTDEDELYPREATEEKVSLSESIRTAPRFLSDSPSHVFTDGLTLRSETGHINSDRGATSGSAGGGRRHPADVQAVLPVSSLTI